VKQVPKDSRFSFWKNFRKTHWNLDEIFRKETGMNGSKAPARLILSEAFQSYAKFKTDTKIGAHVIIQKVLSPCILRKKFLYELNYKCKITLLSTLSRNGNINHIPPITIACSITP